MTGFLLFPFRFSPISTHMPLARHDNPTTSLDTIALNFYSHASCEAWHGIWYLNQGTKNFYSHASCEAWHIIYRNKKTFWISTHMPLARHDTPPLKSIVKTVISTHMPLARHDSYDIHYQLREADFYSHASCEAWPAPWWKQRNWELFLLTCLLRGMTISAGVSLAGASFLLTCLLRGMTSIDAIAACISGFLLTCLLRGMTVDMLRNPCAFIISTHMPLARHDKMIFGNKAITHDFYSHASCEAWHRARQILPVFSYFYSHASCEAWQSKTVLIFSASVFLLTCLLRGMTSPCAVIWT